MKKGSVFIFAAAGLLLFSGCSNVKPSQRQLEMYSDSSLISDDYDSTSSTKLSGTSQNGRINYRFRHFYGSYTVWREFLPSARKVEVVYDSTVGEGKIKGVLILSNNEMIEIFEGHSAGSRIVSVPEGKSRFKIVGHDAAGKVDLHIRILSDQ